MLRLPKLTFLRKDGTTFPGEISNAVFTNRHGQVITSMLIRDLSERKRIEHRMAPGDIPAQKETGVRGRTSWCAGRSAPARKRSRV